MSYNIIAKQNWEQEIFYKHYGSYQWDWILITEKDWILRIYKDFYWSCSWCDSLEAVFWYNDPIVNSKKTVDFCKMYEPFLERNINTLTEQDIIDWVTRWIKADQYSDIKEKDINNIIKFLKNRYLTK